MFFIRFMFNNILLQIQKYTLFTKIITQSLHNWRYIRKSVMYEKLYKYVLCIAIYVRKLERNMTILCIVLYYKTENIKESVKYNKSNTNLFCALFFMWENIKKWTEIWLCLCEKSFKNEQQYDCVLYIVLRLSFWVHRGVSVDWQGHTIYSWFCTWCLTKLLKAHLMKKKYTMIYYDELGTEGFLNILYFYQ